MIKVTLTYVRVANPGVLGRTPRQRSAHMPHACLVPNQARVPYLVPEPQQACTPSYTHAVRMLLHRPRRTPPPAHALRCPWPGSHMSLFWPVLLTRHMRFACCRPGRHADRYNCRRIAATATERLIRRDVAARPRPAMSFGVTAPGRLVRRCVAACLRLIRRSLAARTRAVRGIQPRLIRRFHVAARPCRAGSLAGAQGCCGASGGQAGMQRGSARLSVPVQARYVDRICQRLHRGRPTLSCAHSERGDQLGRSV